MKMLHRNGIHFLLTLIAALTVAGCGRAGDKIGGNSDASTAQPGAHTPSNAPATNDGASAAPSSVASTTQAPPAASGSVVQTAATSVGGTRGASKAHAAAPPKPQIGSGGNDLYLFTQARGAINTDAELKGANVIVEVKEGVVTLSGTVATPAQKSKAEQLARGVGSKDVRNQLKVSASK